MKYIFNAFGHSNILGTHKTTLEFTKDMELTLNGDCIVGVNADFNLNEIKKFMAKLENKKIIITIETIQKNGKKIQETIIAELNPNFKDGRELVIRKTDFASERTFAIRANKAAFELDRDLIAYLKEKKNKIIVAIEYKTE